ncbi:hypothetical protein NDU88_006546 [Pleurodeles waltl]|uniref:Uncharacterized protein n=1 Tax=Pleurodeles waltl TaxID=8319 RepID=A0AAV7PLB3_PLEWA|nr:hypothetical protein NDU88_006546 [Pleurodeles waltl]
MHASSEGGRRWDPGSEEEAGREAERESREDRKAEFNVEGGLEEHCNPDSRPAPKDHGAAEKMGKPATSLKRRGSTWYVAAFAAEL